MQTCADVGGDAFAELDPRSTQGTFNACVIVALEAGVLVPPLLWVITDAHCAYLEQAGRALRAVENWTVRVRFSVGQGRT